jgi:AcrR family transcriptional regulator
MNVSGDLNRSVRNTKRKLRASLMKMVLRKPLRSITVKELTNDADVNRSTFYFHYQDVKAMVKEMEGEFFNDFAAALEAIDQKSHESLLILVRCLENHMDLCKIVLGSNGDMEFLEEMKNIIEEKISRIWKSAVPEMSDEDLQILDAFLIGGVVSTLQRWVREEPRASAEALAAVLNRLIFDGLCPVVAAWQLGSER